MAALRKPITGIGFCALAAIGPQGRGRNQFCELAPSHARLPALVANMTRLGRLGYITGPDSSGRVVPSSSLYAGA